MALVSRPSRVVEPPRPVQTRIFIYQSLTSYLSGACNPVTSGSSEVAGRVRVELSRYLTSVPLEDVIGAIIRSVECRKFLLELSSVLGVDDDSGFRAAVREDEERLASHVSSILDSESATATVLSLEGERAQCFLDVVQDALDRGSLMGREHILRRIIRKLSETSDTLPSSLFMTGVTGIGAVPAFGGAFGDIYQASYNNQVVALKHFRYFTRGSELRRIHSKFGREALLWKELNHPNILPFLGIDRESFPLSFCMVSPWMENGTVLTFLKDHGRSRVDKLLHEIAQGLEYLHSRHIVHGDLRGGNILITSNWQACLADFGLSIFSDVTASTSSMRAGSTRWMAPELIHPDQFGGRFARTPASDVYAFGCVCYELYTGKPPFPELSEPAAFMKVLRGERPGRPTGPPHMSDTLWANVALYWANNPAARPTTQTVVESMAPPLSSAWRPQIHISIPAPSIQMNSAGLTPRFLSFESQRFQIEPHDSPSDEDGLDDTSQPPSSVGSSVQLINEESKIQSPVSAPLSGSTYSSSIYSPAKPSTQQTLRKKAPPALGMLRVGEPLFQQFKNTATLIKDKGKSRWWPRGNNEFREREDAELIEPISSLEEKEFTPETGFMRTTTTEDWNLLLDICNRCKARGRIGHSCVPASGIDEKQATQRF